jgi:transposase-like protein
MVTRQRRSFTDDYKRQAVDLVASSGRSIGSVAKELGLRDSVLRRWVELRGAGREPRTSLAFLLVRCIAAPEVAIETTTDVGRSRCGISGSRLTQSANLQFSPAFLMPSR